MVLVACGFAVAALTAAPALAAPQAPYNSPIIDGAIGSDWEIDENVLSDLPDDSPWGGNELRELWVTWDVDNLYIGIEFSVSGNGMTVYIDAGSGGTISFRSADGWSGAWARDVTSERDIEIFMGGWDGADLNAYRADSSSSIDISGQCESSTGTGFDSEVALPWDEIYPGGFPVGAEIRIATLLVGGDDYYAADAMPDQPTVGDDTGPDVLENFQTIAVDADSDGVPDFGGTYIGGTVRFEDVVTPPYPVARIHGYSTYTYSSTDDGSWQIYGPEIGDTLGEIIIEAAGYRGVYVHGVIVTDPPNDTVDVTLEPFTGAIRGEVVPATECSLVAVFTFPTDSGDYSISAWTDAEGEFIIDHLAGVCWNITAYPTSPDYSPTTAESICVAEPETSDVIIYLEAASVLRQWNDATGDDYGPGSYTYPTEPVFVDGAFDIISVKIKDYDEAGQIEFEIEMGDLPTSQVVDWAPYYPPVNLQKIDIYIDAHGGGSSQGLPNRAANLVPTDYWDWAISADGWWVGMLASNGQSIFDGYTQNVTDVAMTADTTSDIIRIRVNKSAFTDNLGAANWSEFENWDFIAISMGHDGSGLDGVRWVNAGSASQWQFGGGAESDIDPNIIDMTVSAGLDPGTGEPKEPADPQEEQLDYTVSTPVELSAHRAMDLTPPTIDYHTDEELAHLLGTKHLLIRAEITDDIAAIEAWLHYRTISDWDSVAMGPSDDGNIWFGDIPVTHDVESENFSDSLHFYFTAEDAAGNRAINPDDGDSAMPLYPYAVHSDNPSREIEAAYSADSFVICVSASVETLEFSFPTGDYVAFARNDLDNTGEPLCVTLSYPDFVGSDGDLARISSVRRFFDFQDIDENTPVIMRLHWLAERTSTLNNDRLVLCDYGGGIPKPFGGRYYDKASLIVGEIYAGSDFWLVGEDLRGFEDRGVLRNIRFSPNPFSPNGDGVYERVAISWESDFDGSMDIDIYNLHGEKVKLIYRNVSLGAGVSPTVWWDGADDSGSTAKAGIYAVRFEYTYIGDEGVELKIRENKPVVIIK